MAGYNLTDGADLPLFALTASLCRKIVGVDGWMGKMIEKQDFDQMELNWHKVTRVDGKKRLKKGFVVETFIQKIYDFYNKIMTTL